MVIETIVVSIVTLFNLFLGFLTYYKGKQNRINRTFFLLILCVSAWSIFNFLGDYTAEILSSESLSTFYTKCTFASAMLIPSVFLVFSILFPKIKRSVSYFTTIPILLWGLCVAMLSFNNFILQEVQIRGQQIKIIMGPLSWIYTLHIFVFFIVAFYILFKKYLSTKSIEKMQIQYVFLGTIFSAVGGAITNLILPLMNESLRSSRYGPYFTVFLIAFSTYGIIAYRLFDIRIIVKRTIIYSVLLVFVMATYTIVVFSFAALFGSDTQITFKNSAANIVAALLIAFGFDPLRRWLTNVTDKYLFKGEYSSQEVLNKLSTMLSSVIDLDEALISMMQLITKEMRLKNAATFILTSFDDVIEVKRVRQTGYRDPSVLKLTTNGQLIKYLSSISHDSVLVTEELVRELTDKDSTIINSTKFDFHRIAVKLQKLRAAVTVPIFVKERMIGIFVVGEKLSGDIFTNQDLSFLKAVAGQTASAIEKARFYEEDQLKTEFVSIASHELLTPTAAIEGYLSMILDDKIVKVDPKTRDFLEKVYKSSRRLAELVKDLLQVSRIEAGRIVVDCKAFDLTEKITSAIDGIKITADQKKIDLKYDEPKGKIPQAFADPEKVTQVITNLISNGIKYNNDGGAVTIGIEVEEKTKNIKVSVTDTGIGMSENTIAHLFEKFYRSPEVMSYYQGTGLGLYISKNLIEKMQGKMEVKSALGQGSTFSFTIPIYTGSEQRQIIGDPKLMTPEQRHAAGIEDDDGVVIADSENTDDALTEAKPEIGKEAENKELIPQPASSDKKSELKEVNSEEETESKKESAKKE